MNRRVFSAAFAAYVIVGFVGFRFVAHFGLTTDEAFFFGSLAMAAAALTAIFTIELHGRQAT